MDTALLAMPKSWSSAKEALGRCLANHESCRKRARLSTIWSSDNMHIIRDLGVKDLMPRRLLLVLPNMAGVRLVELGEGAEEFPFVALSYSWGRPTPKTLKTTIANLGDMIARGLALSDLPATFADAVDMIQALGYEYLWIDALCIVQDDAEDWKNEAPRMAVIYGNAVCTLHALDSSSAEGGLMPRAPGQTVPGMLNTRAWTTQEMAISPRSLLFSSCSVRWECREEGVVLYSPPSPPYGQEKEDHAAPAAEEQQHHVGRPRTNNVKALFVFFRDWRPPGHVEDGEPSEDGYMDLDFGNQYDDDGYLPFFHAWWDFVSCYTARNLTFESDRFLAMNGIAAVAQRWARIRTSWGLWLDGLERELLWYVDTNPISSGEGELEGIEAGARRTAKWLAPSWSWASLKGGARIRNGVYDRIRDLNKHLGEQKTWPALMIKPQITIPYGTSFDQSLPIPAWRSRESQTIQLSGDLRKGQVVARKVIGAGGHTAVRYEVESDPVGRWSEEEKYDFRPDAAAEFPEEQPVKVWCLLVHRFDAQSCGLSESVNVSLVLRQRGQETEIGSHTEYVGESELYEERTFTRVGYMETMFKAMRDSKDINEDFWWKVVFLL